MGLIISNGHSRVPIYVGTPTNIIGAILVRYFDLSKGQAYL